jgi:hypothetical protein
MTQKNEVLTREDNCISIVCRTRTAAQEDCLTITGGETPVNTTEQPWIFEVGETTPVSRTAPKLVSALVKITKWSNRIGSGKVDDSCLESRHNIQHNFRTKGIGL